MKTLPVYRLAIPPQPSLDQMHDLARGLFGIEDYSLHEARERRVLRSTTQVIDVDAARGAVWAADRAELWNPEAKPQLPGEQKARQIAEEFVRENALLPTTERDDRFVVEPLHVAGSYVATLDEKTGERQERQLDQRVSYGVRLVVSDPETDSTLRVPVMGEVGKFGVTLGDAGRVIGYSGAWRPLDTVETRAAYIPREVADQRFKKLTAHLTVEWFDADLAYAYATSPEKQQYLYPVWAYRAMGNIRGHKFPLRIITLPATEFGPQPRPSEPQPERSKREIPRAWETMTKRSLRVSNPYEAGASWIGEIGGLNGSRKNTQGFIDGLKDAGWNINFNWGNCNAWETDWHENDDDYVDAADFVWYTGHANGNGWMLVEPGSCSGDDMTYLEAGAVPETPGDIWGQQDLEWIIIAACGPLEDDLVNPPPPGTGGGDVFRWKGAFDGLHILMGYGAVTADNEEEGQRVIEYAREGQPLIDAWFRTAQEIQGATNGWDPPYGPIIYVGAMWASKSGQPSPRNDHLWGYGSVAVPDPEAPGLGFTCMWAPC